MAVAQTRKKENDTAAGEVARAEQERLCIDVHERADPRQAMIEDVRSGLQASRKTLPPKYLYDEVGARLFDEICEQPEYYPTRTEEELLERIAGEVIDDLAPQQLVELGSGASRKTRTLLNALAESRDDACYVPVDVSEEMLRCSAENLCRAYPNLFVHGVVGDYEHHLRHLPASDERMVAFLGSTIGNFSELEGRRFLRTLRQHLATDDALLIGFDLVKPAAVLNAAYNDAAGVTALFNQNVLHVINRELDGDFDVTAFRHEAFFNERDAQIEMHLRPQEAQHVRIAAADLDVHFAAGESVRTEISRKFSRLGAEKFLRAGGFSPRRWYESENGYFGLALALAAAVV